MDFMEEYLLGNDRFADKYREAKYSYLDRYREAKIIQAHIYADKSILTVLSAHKRVKDGESKQYIKDNPQELNYSGSGLVQLTLNQYYPATECLKN